ncbi:sulfatase-like hydrolase/transferase [Pseudescherichia sp.]|uniref:sulfatase-like hydrolase/transferase n=1 Tax=Pseudescherichia sp. TaxID=2055881 RepID=UPI0028A74FC3|nr:sulfatase-like hydrolase/transferase [Pseudescherichia sp.]
MFLVPLVVLIVLTYASRKMLLVKTILTCLMILVFGFWFVSDMFTGRGVTDAVYYQILNSAKGSSIHDIIWKVVAAGLFFAVFLSLLVTSYFLRKKPYKSRKFITPIYFVLFALTLFYSVPATNVYSSLSNLKYSNSVYASKFYVKPAKSKDNYNYVVIYAESLERTFRNLDGVNYIPRLSKIADSYDDFTNLIQTEGAGWTMAGLVNTQCGIPLSLPQGNSANNLSAFLEGAKCIGQKFQEEGYQSLFIRGSDKAFAGGDKFLSQHGWGTLQDKEYFLKNNIVDPKKVQGWGVEDDALLSHAWDEFNRLSQHEGKFVLSLLTVNTHAPSGMVLKSCEPEIPSNIKNNMLRAVSCSDYLLSNFIEKIINSDHFDNTIIVLTSDHLMMANDASSMLNKHQNERRNNFIVIKKDRPAMKNSKLGTLMDVWPTVFDIANQQDVGVGFGVSLLKKESSGLVDWFLKNKNIAPFIGFSSTLWNNPSLSDRMVSDGNTIKIGDKQYNLPLYASVGKDNKFMDVYFDSFAIDAEDLINKNEKIVYATQCYVVNGKSDGTCLYIMTKDRIVKRTINEKGITSEKASRFTSPLYIDELSGFSSGGPLKTTGTTLNPHGRVMPRGITFYGFNPGDVTHYESINFDTCAGKSIDIDGLYAFMKKHQHIIFASNDSPVCDGINVLDSVKNLFNSNQLMTLAFRQQIGGVINGNNANAETLVGYPLRQLDFFVNLKNNQLFSLCSVLNDC